MKLGERHSPEARARIAESTRAAMRTPAMRARVSKLTRAAMANPAVRARIKAGMRGVDGRAVEAQALRDAWNAARATVRQEFIGELLGPLAARPRQ
jgi:hypothetical protein